MARSKQKQRQKQKPKRHNALYLSLACSLLGVAAGSSSSQWGQNAPKAAFVSPTTPDKSIQQKERNSRVRLFSSLPLWSSKSTSSPSLQHADHLHHQIHHPYPSKRIPDSNARGPSSSSTSSQLHSTAAASLVLGGYGYSASYSSTPYYEDDPFDPNFRPPSWEDTWGPPPVVVSPSSSAATAAATMASDAAVPFRIYCDLDGVLCDFEHGVQTICRKGTHELAKTTMWQTIAKSNCAFFETLPWTPDGPKLWSAIQHLTPDILTGVPDLETARHEKFNWCRRHLGMQDYRHVDMAGHGYHHASVNGTPKACKVQDGPITNVITCWSYNKHHESGQHAVLIDDRLALKDSWEAKGGIFVHHTDAETTLQKLHQLGVPIRDPYDDKGDLPRP